MSPSLLRWLMYSILTFNDCKDVKRVQRGQEQTLNDAEHTALVKRSKASIQANMLPNRC